MAGKVDLQRDVTVLRENKVWRRLLERLRGVEEEALDELADAETQNPFNIGYMRGKIHAIRYIPTLIDEITEDIKEKKDA